MRKPSFALVPSLLLAVTACEPAPDDVERALGTEGRVAFEYQRNCLFGCPIEQPLLAGARQTIRVDGPGDDVGIEAIASDPELARFAIERTCHCERAATGAQVEIAEDAACGDGYAKHCDNAILVEGLVAGDVFLELRDEDGDLVDRVELRIREAADARFAITYPDGLGAEVTSDFELTAGENAEVEVDLYDDEGRVLLAPEGVAWSIDDADVATVTAWLVGSGAMVEAGTEVSLNALAPGRTTLRVRIAGLEADASIDVSAP